MLVTCRRLAVAWSVVVLGCGSRVTVEGAQNDPNDSEWPENPATSPRCGRTNDRLELELERHQPTHEVWGCNSHLGNSSQGELVLRGVVLKPDPTVDNLHFGFTTCSPLDTSCEQVGSYFSVWAPGLRGIIPFQALIEIQLKVDRSAGCTQQVLIRNLPSWGGLTNPWFSDERLWLAAGDGVPTTFVDAPFAIEKVAQGCYSKVEKCDAPKDDFLLRFKLAADPTNLIDLAMGETASWQLASPQFGTQQVSIRNLRSYQSHDCEQGQDWGYWMSALTLEDEFR